MLEIINTSVNKQQYTAPDSGNLVTGVKKIMLCLTPRSILIIGFGDSNNVLAARYADYKNVQADWVMDFFEHQFINESLLNDAEKVTTVFIGTESNMVIPASLYNTETAMQWLRKLHYVEYDDVVSAQQLDEDDAHYVYAWPQMIKDLVKRYFPKGKTYPLALMHFGKGSSKQGTDIQCSLSNQHAYITLRNNGKLIWHEVLPYNTPEDITYRIVALCKEKNIQNNAISCNTLSAELVFTINKLSQYFEVSIGNSQSFMNQNSWEAVIHLSKQLYSCV